ncbi:alpha carbonic anhydrase 7-like [Vigna radiata var. radiata]|uniref:Carbonic anhydrase n=1 Tax=Vigna radiata var. radiata TaxID=3916 RepID=A0A1S3TML1_VIGRR|nr:alpha carbonic anhydrase 7-like [Vigna radiata var. radiata]
MKRISIAISLISILFCSAILTRALPEDEPEFGYDEDSANGPQYWGDIKEAWETCKTGQIQSPIDLSTNVVQVIPKSGSLKYWTYNPQYATLSNRGHDVAVNLRGDAGSIDIDGSSFFLQQIHWHWPSEHTIDGRRYDLELHMVHVSPQADGTNKTAVVGVLYEYGSPDPLLSRVEQYLVDIPKENEEESVGEIDPSEIMSGKMFYRYIGSLTAPPCTEGIIWTIDKEIRTVSIGQVELLKNTVLIPYAPRNARPLQPLNQRNLRLYVSKNKPLY